MKHTYPLTQRDLLALDRRRDIAHDRFITGQASDPRIACALDRLAEDVAKVDGDGAEAATGRGDETF